MSKPTDPLSRFRSALRTQLRQVSPDVRDEILRGVDEQIAAEIADLGHDPSPQEKQAIAAKLGTPESVAEQARNYSPAYGLGSRRSLAGGWVLVIVLLLQVVGIGGTFFLIPILAAIAGIVLCCLSPLYTAIEKLLTAVFTVAGVAGVILALQVGLQGMDGCYDPAKSASNPDALPKCSDLYSASNKLMVTGGAILALAGIAVAVVIAIRAALRRQRTLNS